MNVTSYTNCLNKADIHLLREEILSIKRHDDEMSLFGAGEQTYYWLNINDKPHNLVEQYIQKAYEVISKEEDAIEGVVGLEWWIHHTEKDRGYVPWEIPDRAVSHIDRDEVEFMFTKKFKTPKRSFITYLTTIDDAPTVIVDGKLESEDASNVDKEINNIVYSFPEEGKITTFGEPYIHSAYPEMFPESERITLMFNVWCENLDDDTMGRIEKIGEEYKRYREEGLDGDELSSPRLRCSYKSEFVDPPIQDNIPKKMFSFEDYSRFKPEQCTSTEQFMEWETVLYMDVDNTYTYKTATPIKRPTEILPTIKYNSILTKKTT